VHAPQTGFHDVGRAPGILGRDAAGVLERKMEDELIQFALEEAVGFQIVVVELILCEHQPLGVDDGALRRVEFDGRGLR